MRAPAAEGRVMLVEERGHGIRHPGMRMNTVGDGLNLRPVLRKLQARHLAVFLGDRVDKAAGVHGMLGEVDEIAVMRILPKPADQIEFLVTQDILQKLFGKTVMSGRYRCV